MTPQLQVPVAGPTGQTYFVDFGLAEVRAFGEFDGKDKYLDVALRRGAPLEQVLLEEKRREDWIRGTTQWRFARWEDEHSATRRRWLRGSLLSASAHPAEPPWPVQRPRAHEPPVKSTFAQRTASRRADTFRRRQAVRSRPSRALASSKPAPAAQPCTRG